ncbi:MAG: hypothetical protein KBC96_11060 [Armatimonadetes bacterium]|nr:hypothetical protein [Armatimonadota bacterium]
MHHFDWMLWSVEACGVLILCIWIAVPIREFKQIARRLREKQGHDVD